MGVNNYPLIFKQCVLEYYNNNNNIKISDVITIFKISRKTFQNWKVQYLNNNLKEKEKYVHVYNKITAKIKLYIRNKVVSTGIVNRKLLKETIKKRFKTDISVSSIYNILSKMNITIKKVRKRFISCSKEKHKQNIKNFKKRIKYKSRNNIIAIDEFSADTHIIKEYQWSKKGKKIIKEIKASKKRYTVTCAISNNKVIYYEFIEGSSNAINFRNFLTNLKNKLNDKYIKYYYLLDNASIHHAKIIQKYINDEQMKLIFNAPYCPQYNPIEKVFSIVKNLISIKDNLTLTKLKNNVTDAFNNITISHLNSFYKKSLNFCRK